MAKSLATPRNCEHCKKEFRPRMDAVKKGQGRFCSRECWKKSLQTIDVPMEKIVEMYTAQDMTMKEISETLGIGWRAVQYRLKRSGTKIRSKKRRRGKNYPVSNGQREHQRNATAKYGRKKAPNEVTHHLDMDKSNANPENLVFATRTKHGQIHHQMEMLVGEMLRMGLVVWDAKQMKYKLK